MRSTLLAAMLVAAHGGLARAEPITVFAAASLTDALEAVGAAYGARTGAELRFAFASSSTLARQIEAGAPAHIYVSADERWMDDLEAQGLIEPGTRVSPIGNRLVVIAADEPKGAAGDIGALLNVDGRLAVGDPEHVPAGRYARDALETLEIWDDVEPRLARADNARAALALVERGEAPYGVVYATDAAVVDHIDVVSTFPADSHTPITYPFAIVAGGDGADVRDFFTFMTGDEALAIYARFGFVVG